jgi:hypothetical protein
MRVSWILSDRPTRCTDTAAALKLEYGLSMVKSGYPVPVVNRTSILASEIDSFCE